MPQDRDGRSIDSPDERPPVVLGAELAQATAAEAHHREAAIGPSPLAGVEYDFFRGEGDLFRFIESPRDNTIGQFIDSCRGIDPSQRGEVRSSLTMDDFYTLITFARRRALLALRKKDPAVAVAGIEAVSMIDAERIDWRDAVWVSALLGYAGDRTGLNVSETFTASAATAEPGMAEILRRFAHERVDALENAWGFRPLETPSGIVLASDGGKRFTPGGDLVSMAFKIVALIETGPWRVSDVETGSNLPAVWLRRGDSTAVEAALALVRACVSISGALSPTVSADSAEQQLTVFLGEFSDPDAADAIAAATGPGPRGGFVGLGVAVGRVSATVVSRFVMDGVDSYENDESIQRFRVGLLAILSG